ncbi:MAG: sodium:proline symporter, partial [Salinicola sp.]|nr:sodium:proline symporter [Salinicola sp.]
MTNNDNAVVVATFVLYFLVMLIIGYAAWKRSSDFSDYVLGGRSLGPFATAISAGASEMSGWLMVAMPGAAYLSGLSAFWIAAGLLAGSLLNWLLVAQRLRVYSFVANDALTIPEFLAERFQRHTGGLRLVASIFIIVFYLFYTSSGLVAGGKLLNTVFGMNYELAVVVGLLAIVSYTFFGGYLAVSWTDVLQGIMMLLALVAVPVAAVMELGGVTASLESVREASPMLLRWFTDAASGETLGWIVVASSLAWGLGYFGQPHSLARFAGIDDHRHIPRARLLSVSWTGIGLVCALAIGVLGHGFFPAGLDDEWLSG